MSTSYFPWRIGQVSSSDGIIDVKGMVIAGMRVELRYHAMLQPVQPTGRWEWEIT